MEARGLFAWRENLLEAERTGNVKAKFMKKEADS